MQPSEHEHEQEHLPEHEHEPMRHRHRRKRRHSRTRARKFRLALMLGVLASGLLGLTLWLLNAPPKARDRNANLPGLNEKTPPPHPGR